MASLKSLIPQIAKALDMKPAAIYERQRALVRAGLIEMQPGHGPGSGVRANPESLAMLLIALAATGSLSETEELTTKLTKLKCKAGRCQFTGKQTLAAALSAILASEPLTARLALITISRSATGSHAEIFLREKPGSGHPGRGRLDKFAWSEFGATRTEIANMRVATTLYLHWLAEVKR
jgi:DNA-binding IscR family transcriptional regulator